MISVRPPAVAGLFYPAAAAELQRDIDALLAAAEQAARAKPVPKAIIVPHAGYIYSGPIAAAAYARLAPARDLIKRVVLLGPVHRVPIRGLALPAASMLATPLGNVPAATDQLLPPPACLVHTNGMVCGVPVES